MLLVGCASRDTRLEGRWKSNKAFDRCHNRRLEATLRQATAPHKRALLASLFGKLTVTYDRGTVTTELPSPDGKPPYRNSSRYRIVASDDDSLAYVSTSPLTKEREINHVYFDGPNRYWIYLHRTGMKEYFDRLTP